MAPQEFEIRKFRLKRPHNKSKFGCRTCKRRRVKCDERQPECNQCRVRGLECAFDPISPPSILITDEAAKDGRQYTRRHPPIDGLTAHEQFLVRRYLAHVVSDFSHSNALGEQIDFWRVTVPAVAYTSPIVRHGMLALASLSLHFDLCTPIEERNQHMQVAIINGDTAIKLCRQVVQDLRPDNVDAMLAGSRMIAVLGFAFFRDHRRSGVSLYQPEAWNWLRAVRGIVAVQESFMAREIPLDEALKRDWESSSAASLYGTPGDFLVDSSASPHPFSRRQAMQLHFIQQTQAVRFQALRTAASAAEHGYDMLQAIDTLERITELVCTAQCSGIFRILCTWPCQISQVFVRMLEGGHNLARAVHMHWLMLVVLIEDCWWVDAMGRAGIQEIAGSGTGSSDEIRGLLEWPLSMLDTCS